MRPGITVAVMVKDDATRLKRCLESVKGLADEIVVLDTGSTDDSVKVAEEAGARVDRMEWPGRFDEPLNRLFGMVETEWTLRLDSDEWLLPETHDAIREATRDEHVHMVLLLRRNLYDNGAPSDHHIPRLWRTHPAMRVAGVVHENFPDAALKEAAGERGFKASDILFMHDGYTEGGDREKTKRNAVLIKRALAEQPDNVYYEVALAEALISLGDPMGPHKVDELVDRALDDDPAMRVVNMILMFKYVLENTPKSHFRSRRVQHVVNRVLEWYGSMPFALWTVADFEMRRGNMNEVYRVLRHLEALVENGQINRVLPVRQEWIGPQLWSTLGQIAARLGDRDTARRNFARLAEAFPDDQNVRAALASVGG
jgi:glycosyltransferase involved in cell wall biosynthesis